MRRCKSCLILVAFTETLLSLFLVPELLECDYVLGLLLEDELVDFLLYLGLDFFLVYVLFLLQKVLHGIWVLFYPLLDLLIELVYVVDHHQSEGQGVQNVEELVRLKVVIGWQLQRGDELVLNELTLLEALVKA